MFPDQDSWADRCCARAGGESLARLWESTGYAGPPELFTMWACLLSCAEMAEFGPRDIENQA